MSASVPVPSSVVTGATERTVSVNGVDATSLLGIMALGLSRGMTAEISSSGPEASEAIAALSALLESGFGEKDE